MTVSPTIGEVLAALRQFAFLEYPDMFNSTDGGCSEIIIADEDVQRARDIISRSSPQEVAS